MRRILIALAAFAFIPALAHAQAGGLNNEAVCSSPGYSMDPRCVGGASSYDSFSTQQRGLIIVQPQPRRR